MPGGHRRFGIKSAFAGFSAVEPWLPVGLDAAGANVARERDDPSSLLSHYRRLIALRRTRPALTAGTYRPLPSGGESLAYLREAVGDRVVVALNFSANPVTVALPDLVSGRTVLISTRDGRDGESVGSTMRLSADEAVVIGQACPGVTANPAKTAMLRSFSP